MEYFVSKIYITIYLYELKGKFYLLTFVLLADLGIL
jgi:hypothetical protein